MAPQKDAALIALRLVFRVGMQLDANECTSTYTAGPLSLGNAVDCTGTAGLPLSRNFTATYGALHSKIASFLGNRNENLFNQEFCQFLLASAQLGSDGNSVSIDSNNRDL